jgi:hypothetical protein
MTEVDKTGADREARLKEVFPRGAGRFGFGALKAGFLDPFGETPEALRTLPVDGSEFIDDEDLDEEALCAEHLFRAPDGSCAYKFQYDICSLIYKIFRHISSLRWIPFTDVHFAVMGESFDPMLLAKFAIRKYHGVVLKALAGRTDVPEEAWDELVLPNGCLKLPKEVAPDELKFIATSKNVPFAVRARLYEYYGRPRRVADSETWLQLDSAEDMDFMQQAGGELDALTDELGSLRDALGVALEEHLLDRLQISAAGVDLEDLNTLGADIKSLFGQVDGLLTQFAEKAAAIADGEAYTFLSESDDEEDDDLEKDSDW